MKFKGLVFDLDGTLVDSKLDFDQLRNDLGLSPQEPILEAVQEWPLEKQRWAHQIIDNHELAGAQCSVIYPGVAELLQTLAKKQVPSAVFTRNSRRATEITLDKHNLRFSHVITRNDAPAKPDPTGLLQIAKHFQLVPRDILYVGDYLYDLKAGLAAQIPTALYLSQTPVDFDTNGAHFIFSDYHQLIQFLHHEMA